MKQYEVQMAVQEITGNRIQKKEQETLEDFMWEAINEWSTGKMTRARAVIDFMHRSGKISLTEALQLADLLG